MPRYLTNVDRDEATAFRVYAAAVRSGMNVRYLDCPVPPELVVSIHYSRNYHAGNFNNMGCIVSFEVDRDLSRFWLEYDKLA